MAPLRAEINKWASYYEAQNEEWKKEPTVGHPRDCMQDLVAQYGLGVYEAAGGAVAFTLADDEQTIVGPTAEFLGLLSEALPDERRPSRNTFVRRAKRIHSRHERLPHRAWVETDWGPDALDRLEAWGFTPPA